MEARLKQVIAESIELDTIMHRFRWLCLIFLVLAASARLAVPEEKPAGSAGPRRAYQETKLRGKVVPYKPALERMLQIKLAKTWGEDLLALETDDGKLLPILPTEEARFFYQDPQMHNRPVELKVRIHERTSGLQLIEFNTVKDGKLNEIYYWCDVCAIKLFASEPCVCCQGPLEVREHPVGEPFQIKN
jgi:hypothetical protein